MQKGIGSVDTAVALLRILEQAPGAMSLTQIAKAAGFQLSKTHHYLVSLVRTGLANQDPSTGQYALGSYALQIGLSALAKTDVSSLAAQAVRNLRDATGHTTFFSLWGDRGPLIVHSEQGLRPLSVHLKMGTVLPLWGSATADVFLAWMPENLVAPAIANAVEGRRLSARQVAEIRARARAEGIAHEASTRTPNVAALAAPVFSRGGSLAGALTSIGFIGEFDDHPRSKDSKVLRKHAGALSQSLGFHAATEAQPHSAGGLRGR